MSLFRNSDLRVRRVPSSSLEAACYRDIDDDSPAEIEIVTYEAPSEVVRDRLELAGFTLPTALELFNRALGHEESRQRELRKAITRPTDPDPPDEDDPPLKNLTTLKNLTALSWIDGLRAIREGSLTDSHRDDPNVSAVVRHMLAHRHTWFGFPGYDVRLAVRLALEVCKGDDVVYDLTDLVLGAAFDSSEFLAQHVDWVITEGVVRTRPVIVLTEGVTDKRAIEGSLAALYPHLAEHYRFMDFEGARVSGGAGSLAALVKAFVGAGIANRVVALFDNDTAATVAMRPLSQISLPRNIKVLQYPVLPLATRYPTIGPSGVVMMDVNGLAGSIELYFGRDVLQRGTELVPVQWKGFDEGLRRYQGEITDKAGVQQRFEKKLRRAEVNRAFIADQDWTGMSLIVDQLRQAFHADDRAELLENEDASVA